MKFHPHRRLALLRGQADYLKDEFLANTSHELRTLLHGIIGLAESMLAGAGGELPQPALSRLAMITSSGRRLYSLVNDILDLTKIRNNELSLSIKPVDLHTLADQVILFMRTLVKGRELQLHNNIPGDIPLAAADEDRVHQILYNLIGNTVKFTPAGTISIAAQARGGWLEVTDADKRKIFGVFQKLSARPTGGEISTGLGLAITRQLVELHGAKIRVDSEAGRGCTFFVEWVYPACHNSLVCGR